MELPSLLSFAPAQLKDVEKKVDNSQAFTKNVRL